MVVWLKDRPAEAWFFRTFLDRRPHGTLDSDLAAAHLVMAESPVIGMTHEITEGFALIGI